MVLSTGWMISLFLGAIIGIVSAVLIGSRLKNANVRGASAAFLMVGIFLGAGVVSTAIVGVSGSRVLPNLFAVDGVVQTGLVTDVNMLEVQTIQGCPPNIGTIPTPDILFATTSIYQKGTAVTTKNMARIEGIESWTNVAGAASMGNISPGDVLEVVIGMDTTDENAEPYGPTFKYSVPCVETATLKMPDGSPVFVSDDSVAGDLTAVAFDRNGQPMVTATNTNAQVIGPGDVITGKIRWSGAFREDFGNKYACSKTGNIIVAQFNTSEYDDIKLTDLNGNEYPSGTVPDIHSKTTGFTDFAWIYPYIESVAEINSLVVMDADNVANPGANDSNITFSLYATSVYLDGDSNTVKCGVQDETRTRIGAVAADTLSYLID